MRVDFSDCRPAALFPIPSQLSGFIGLCGISQLHMHHCLWFLLTWFLMMLGSSAWIDGDGSYSTSNCCRLSAQN